MEKNSQDPAQLSKIDVESEFDLDLSYNEAVELALRKFPTFFRQDLSVGYGDKPKQIVFVKELIERIVSGKVQVTYRKAPKIGSYYVIDNQFKQKPESSRIL